MNTQIDLAGTLLAALAALPGQLVTAYQANPEPWNQVALMMAALAAMSWIGTRVTRGRRRPRTR